MNNEMEGSKECKREKVKKNSFLNVYVLHCTISRQISRTIQLIPPIYSPMIEIIDG